MNTQALCPDISSAEPIFTEAENAVRCLLLHMGEDPNRDELDKTPSRVLKALREMTAGYREDPAQILQTRFAKGSYKQMIILQNIDFTSLCEHHLLPFSGSATVAYIPDEQIVGLSKLARLVDCFSKRLQLQERLTEQIADALMEHLHPLGAGVILEARHSCASFRGVLKTGASMVTSALSGIMQEPQFREEFLSYRHEDRGSKVFGTQQYYPPCQN